MTVTSFTKIDRHAKQSDWLRVNKFEPVADDAPLKVRRVSSKPCEATLRVPATLVTAETYNVFFDGGTRLGYVFEADGQFKASRGDTKRWRTIRIPAAHVQAVPFGTSYATLTREGGMLVLDLAAITQPEVSA